MDIQVTTDTTIHGHEDFMHQVESETKHVLRHFADQIMSIDIHLSDANGAKHGASDKRCLMTAHCTGRPTVAVSDEASTAETAFHGAVKKLQHLIGSHFDKADEHKGGETIRHETPTEQDEMSAERL